jgi:hypothetical protein
MNPQLSAQHRKPTMLEIVFGFSLILLVVVVLALMLTAYGCYTVTPPTVTSKSAAPDLQTGKDDAGLIGNPYRVDGVLWWATSDDYRADYVRLLAEYKSKLPSPPADDKEGWNLAPPIAANLATLDIMKSLKKLDRENSGK